MGNGTLAVIGLLAGGAAVVVGAFALVSVSGLEARVADVERAQAAAFKQAEQTDEHLAAVKDAVARLRRENGTLRDELQSVAEASRKSAAPAPVAAGPVGAIPPNSRTVVGVDEVASDAATAAAAAEFQTLREKVFDGTATADEQARFWELARTSDVLDKVMSDLEARVGSNPTDADLRMQLSGAYVAKLLSVPNGPERGAWAMKAEGQYTKVLEQDPDHWSARYSLAFSWSQYPPFLNKAPDAIREFETLREVQERRAPEPRQADTYVQLSNLYLRQGNKDKARSTLEDGIRRHPDADGISKALESMGD